MRRAVSPLKHGVSLDPASCRQAGATCQSTRRPPPLPPKCGLGAALLDSSALPKGRIAGNIEEAEKTAKAAKAQHELALSLGKACLEPEAEFTEATRNKNFTSAG